MIFFLLGLLFTAETDPLMAGNGIQQPVLITEESGTFFGRISSCCSGVKKKYIIPAAVITTGGVIAGITYWRLSSSSHPEKTQPQTPPAPSTYEEFWPLHVLLSNATEQLLENFATNQNFFSTLSSLWIALASDWPNSTVCTKNDLAFQQLLDQAGYIADIAVDHDSLKNGIRESGTIVCDVFPTSNQQPGILSCFNDTTLSTENFTSIPKGFICPGILRTSKAAARIFFYSEGELIGRALNFNFLNNSLNMLFMPSFPVGNCTFYSLYLAENPTLTNFLQSYVDCPNGNNGNGCVEVENLGITDTDMVLLAPALRQLTGLQLLQIGTNNIGNIGAMALASALQYLTQIDYLSMHDNNIGADGARVLAPALQKMTLMSYLNMNDNNIGPGGATALAPVLQYFTNMWLGLHIRNNNIDAVGAKALAPILQQLTTLGSLDISTNNIGDIGVVALASAFQQIPCTLGGLNISYNAITAKGISVFADFLPRSGAGDCSEISIDLSNNNIGNEGALALIGSNSGLIVGTMQVSSVYAQHNGIDAATCRLLRDAIHKNSPGAEVECEV